MSSIIRLHNPHSVLAAIATRPKEVLEIQVSSRIEAAEKASDSWSSVLQLARKQGIPIKPASKSPSPDSRRERFSRSNPESDLGGRVSFPQTLLKERAGVSLEELFANAPDRASGKGLWLALDCLQDPHNVGAIFRTAAFFGVQGIILTEERSAPLSSTVYDVASGGVETVPFTLQTNLQRAFEQAKDAGLWILGTSEHASDSIAKIHNDRPWLLVLGNEEKGMRRLTAERCDLLCQIPPVGQVKSLNVSVAAGILISHFSFAD